MVGRAEQRKEWRDLETEASPASPMAEEAVDSAPMVEWEEAPVRRRIGATLLTALLALIAIGWIAALVLGIAAASPPGGPGALRIAAWIGLGSAPLALIAILALLFLRTGRSEATAYARAARDLRAESESLGATLTLLTRRIESARTSLAEQATTLATLGETASERLARVGQDLREDAATVAATARTLDDSAAAARTDIGVLLADLPKAEKLAVALGDGLRALGHGAETQTGLLAERMAALEQAARGADQVSAGAARRLGAELERIEGAAALAERRIGDSAANLAEASANALGDSATALEDVRRGVEAQRASLIAIATQAGATLDRNGDEAARLLATRLDQLGQSIGAIDSRLRGHEGATSALIGQLDQALAGVERRFAALGDSGAEHTATLAEAIVALAEHADHVGRTLGQGAATADTLVARAAALRDQLDASDTTLSETLPAALGRLRVQSAQGLDAIDEAGPRLERMAAATGAIAAQLGAADAALDRQQETLAAFSRMADTRLAELTTQADTFHDLLMRTDADLRGIAAGASTQLVDALLRVRETATQAATHARETLAAAIPAAAARLGEEGARAMSDAMAGVGRDQIAAVGAASTQAVEAAQAAADRLGRQLDAINATAAALETQAGKADDEQFARQVSLLIESLNSSAIDVAKIFSNEPADSAWAAYLKGDRGIFTRRAVHLLDAAEAKTIAARYGDDPEFREQVNRYIHDFETMLRRVLAVREGAAMGVTLLSSDTGKLYVALAQAIERLRR